MSRVNIYSYPVEDDYNGERTIVGWFDPSKASQWSDADYNGNGSGGVGRGQTLCHTAGGKWVLAHWTRWQNESDRYEYVTDDQAREWLIANDEDEAVALFFGKLAEEEDRRPGRPAVGEPVNIRLGDDLLAMVDDYASKRQISRAEAMRRLIQDAVTRARVNDGVPLTPTQNR